FVTQNPIDIPDKVLGQLGNRVQHALRAYTPRDQKAVRAVAETMRANPAIDTEKAILELGVGEALISLLDEKGVPGITERAWMLAPGSQIGPITPDERRALIERSVVAGVYEKDVDRESAFEKLRQRAAEAVEEQPRTVNTTGKTPASVPQGTSASGGLGDLLFGRTGPRGGKHDGLLDILAKSATRSAGSAIGRNILRGVLGSLAGGRRR
ncbi:MAG TPA: helicase HerA-like domain-containing protein, partial [Gemmatimonadaceae bacterium]